MSNEPNERPVDDEAPLTALEADVANLTFGQAPDPFITSLVKRAYLGLGVGIVVMVNGMMVVGQLTRPEAMAEAIDAEWAGLVARSEKPDDTSDEEWAALVETLSTAETKSIAKDRQEHEDINDRVEEFRVDGILDVTAIPAALGRAAIVDDARLHLTLVNVRINAPGVPNITELPVMRIPLRAVNGWWPIRTDESGNASFKLWDVPAASPPGQPTS